MEEGIVIKQPVDRRLTVETNNLPLGPPGAENDEEYSNSKPDHKALSKDSSTTRRHSPSESPPPLKRKSPSRGPRSPRGRRTPSPRPRCGRIRDYSPERSRFSDRTRIRRSSLRNQSRDRVDHRRNGRDRLRVRRDSRSESRSTISILKRRWSPKEKLISTPIPPLRSQYEIHGSGMYADAYGYGQYGPIQQTYVSGDFLSAPQQVAFTASYPPPPAWTVPAESYSQSNWVHQTEPLRPALMQPNLPVVTQTVVVPPPGIQPTQPMTSIGLAERKNNLNPTHDAVAQEAENQRDELKKQRTSYLKKTAALKKELIVLKEQRTDLIGSHSPTTKGFLDENERLQSQIQKKLSTIENVIDMLTGIIGEDNLPKGDAVISPKKQTKKKRSSSSSSSSDSSSSNSSSSSSSSTGSDSDDNSSPERLKTKAIESMKHKRDAQGKNAIKGKKVKDEFKKFDDKKINYVFYDPEMHWCKICNAFPKTAKDYLTHLHSKDHADMVDTMETPWHSTMTTDEYPSFENAATKRTPIRGLTFFVPATAWYCKLCSVWMGDLHCASLHLKSKSHSTKYNTFLEKNPHFEVDWLADRQRTLNEKKTAPPPPQITSVSTTAGIEPKEGKNKSKHEDKEKSSKKRKKKNLDKKEKKKKKRSKKRKKTLSSLSSNESSSDTEMKASKKNVINSLPVAITCSDTLLAPSIRVQMRNLQREKNEIETLGPAPPPPPTISEPTTIHVSTGETAKKDDLISQWNAVQPVISDSEKKLLEQLKGKLKNKPPAEVEKKKDEKADPRLPVQFVKTNAKKTTTEHIRSPVKRNDERKDKDKDKNRGESVHRRRSRSRLSRRSRSLSPNRGRRVRRSKSRCEGMRRSRSRARRSPSRGRFSPRGYGRRQRSRSAIRRRSRSHGRFRRHISSSHSRSRSGSSHRIEKAIVRQPEFRPRVPEVINIKKNKNKTVEGKEKEERRKSSSKSSSGTSNKKLPFIGRMPVLKKQSQNLYNLENEKKGEEEFDSVNAVEQKIVLIPMMQDSCSHAGYEPSMMNEYDDLMPDPVQFVSLMGAPPPPPSQPPPQQYVEEEKDILPPGIDETETEFVPKPISDAPIPRKGPLPKDFEEALNIIFPGEKRTEDEGLTAKSSGETQIITDEPVMQQSDLLKEGIHIMTVEETSLIGMDEVSQMSMNEPLQFNKSVLSVTTLSANNSRENSLDKSPTQVIENVEKVVAACISSIPPPPPPLVEERQNKDLVLNAEKRVEVFNVLIELERTKPDTKSDPIDQPLSPTNSEKIRRQEELDDLAMLGIDADDMAAQCI